MSKIKQYRGKKQHQLGESASNRSHRGVGDSAQMFEGQCITNSAGTFPKLMRGVNRLALGMGAILAMSLVLAGGDTYAANSSINVTISDADIDLNVSPSTKGTFAKSSTSTIGVSTSNYTGYTLSLAAQAGSNPTALINDTDNTKTLPSIESALTEDQFKALDVTTYNNMWGYLPSKYCTGVNSNLNCATNTNFLPSPTTDGDILDITGVANNTVNEYELTVGARVDTTASLGTYSNTFVLYATANAIPYTITYVDNVVGEMPRDASGEALDGTVTIANNTPLRKGYTFVAWCTIAPTATPSGTDACGGTQVAQGGQLELDQQGGSNNFTLYAMWQKSLCNPSGTSIQTINCMQDITSSNKSSILASMATDTQYQLIDKRDEKTYWVAKLKDGNIWMTQNLDLNLSLGQELTSDDTDLTAYNTGAYTSANGYSKSGNTIIWKPVRNTINYISGPRTALGTIPDWTNDQVTPYSVDTGDWYWSGNYYASSNCPSTSSDNYQGCNYATKSPSQYSTYFSTTPYSLNGTHGHVGNYYNWTAAIATNNSSTYTTSTMGNTGNNPANSICPAGWRLPKIDNYTAGSTGTNEFYNLDYYYNSGATNTDAGLIAAPLFLTRSGNVWTSALHNAGGGGLYWSSTVESSTQARYLDFNSGAVNPVSSDSRFDGRSLRCLVR